MAAYIPANFFNGIFDFYLETDFLEALFSWQLSVGDFTF